MAGSKALIASILALITLTAGCTKFKPNDSVQAPVKTGDSFSVVKAGASLGVDPKFNIAIARASLEKEFLLQAELINQTTAAMGSTLKGRIVAFRERGGKIYMLEATQGHSVTTDLPQNLLLAEFPIVSSDATQIVFNFNEGMTSLFTMSGLSAADFSGGQYDPNQQFTAAEVARSFLESAALDTTANRLVIRQVAQIKEGDVLKPIEARYYLTSYQPDASFTSFKTNENLDRFGYFQVAPQVVPQTGEAVIYATRFHPAKPIVFAVSANTPPKYKQAVKDGILYWNKAFGKDVVQVVDAPAGVSAPNPDYNVIQWVPFDHAGFAYADIQADPRTGQTMHVQVFLTSAFDVSSTTRARQILRKLKTTPPSTASRIGLNGFTVESLCNYSQNSVMAEGLTTLLASGPDDATVLKAAQDQIREVTAHEVGHTLGLRHNFAGSLSANFMFASRNDLVAQYFAESKAPQGIVVSSTVMDYLRPEDSYMIGDQIGAGMVMSYDQKAISGLYLDAKYKAEEWPLFCTDTSMGQFFDCEVFDVGAPKIEYISWKSTADLKTLPNTFIETYILNKTSTNPKSVELVDPPSPAALAAAYLMYRPSLLSLLTKSGKILSIQRQFPVVSEVNADLVTKKQIQYVTSEVTRLGGFDVLLAPLPDDYETMAVSKVHQLVWTTYRQGIGDGERAYMFSDEELKVLEANAVLFFEKFAKEYRKAELTTLAGVAKAPKFVQDPLVDQLTAYLADRASKAIFTTTAEMLVADVELLVPDTTPGLPPGSLKKTIKRVNLPKFANSLELRLIGAGMLSAERGEDVNWAALERIALADKLKQIIKDGFGMDLEDIKLSVPTKEVYAWLADNKKVLEQIK